MPILKFMTDEEREEFKQREAGIQALLNLANSIFFYELLEVPGGLCWRCAGLAEFRECLHADLQYQRLICTRCRDKHAQKTFARYRIKRMGDRNRYSITADQAREKARNKVVRVQPSNPSNPTA